MINKEEVYNHILKAISTSYVLNKFNQIINENYVGKMIVNTILREQPLQNKSANLF